MKLKLTWLLTLFMAFVMQFSFAQEKTVTGTVTIAADGLPLPGATVIVKGTSRGTQTDFDGKYSINVAVGDVLRVSYVGYKTTDVVIGSANVYDVVLEMDNALEEVVVVGYQGAVNSAKTASSLSTVKSEAIEQVPINSIDQVLQGNAAGVNVNTGSGQPGQSATILIRGRSSLQGDIEPLFIIDGIPVDQDNFRSLNQNDIESMSVLKDAAATAIYGNRGAGGVILITTKKGKRGSGVTIQYRQLYGVSVNPDPQFEVMNTQQLLTFRRDLLGGNQFGDGLSDAQIAAIARNANTDWTDIFFQQGINQSHELNISTGTERTSSYTSLNYTEQEGTTFGSSLQRFSSRFNYSGSTADNKFNYSTQLTMNYSKSSFIVDAQRGGNTGGQLDNAFLVPYLALPYLSPFNPDGSLNIFGTGPVSEGGSGAFNPDGTVNQGNIAGFVNTPFIALNTVRLNPDVERELKAIGSVSADYNFAKNLTVGAQFGIDYTYIESLNINTPGSIRSFATPTAASEFKGGQSEDFFRNANFLMNAFLRYENDITDKLNLNAAVFGEYNYTNTQNAGFTAFGLNPALPGSGAGFVAGDTLEGEDENGDGILAFGPEVAIPYVPGVRSSESELALASLFATVDLDWDGKYGFSGSIRRDQTSRFVENRSGTFWSVAGRWNIDNEDFMDSVDWLSVLKLRASYGIVGNQTVGSRYQGLQTIASTAGYQNTQAYEVLSLRDTGIQWEETAQFNVGLSFGLFQNRITGELDYYYNETDQLFNQQQISLAGTGFATTNTNVGSLFNRGVDLQISVDVLRQSASNPWGIRLNANTNYNHNEVIDLPGDFLGVNLRVAEGRQANTWWGVRWAGVDPSNGQPLYLDADGNITDEFNTANGVYLNKNFDPSWTGGFGGDISYKGFSLSTLFSYAADRWRNNGSLGVAEDPSLGGVANFSTSMLNAWTTPGQATDIPALGTGSLRFFSNAGDRYLEDASFLRLRNITFAYNFDSEFLSRTKLFKAVRVFVQGTNLITWTKWRGFDPESNDAFGFFDYPVPRTFTAGLDLTF
jgi:TonB-linked SusC/RagA family outer membrane protein